MRRSISQSVNTRPSIASASTHPNRISAYLDPHEPDIENYGSGIFFRIYIKNRE